MTSFSPILANWITIVKAHYEKGGNEGSGEICAITYKVRVSLIYRTSSYRYN